MRYTLYLITAVVLFSGCNILDNDTSNNNFERISPEALESAMQAEVFTPFQFEVRDDSGTVHTVNDTLRYTWQSGEVIFHTYADASEEVRDSLEALFQEDPNLVLSEEQFILPYTMNVDSSTVAGDTSFTFIANGDTTYASLTAAEMDTIYANAGLKSVEADSAFIYNFNIDNEYQNDALSNFKDGIQFGYLKWIPDSRFVPADKFFRIENNTVIFGAFALGNSASHDALQNSVIESYRAFLE
ncbi:hypothetical protein [Gracilimonas tropica]|uniref:hypothetical protein n=1 Tax=Gracilimonas tropica TaxID=454600 RepID=UPI0003633047|nr:hypothetical protein [Gracilimonas tropica]